MTDLRRHLRLSWAVLAAAVGMLSMAVDASASTAKSAPGDAARECCLGRVCAACCCDPAGASPRAESGGQSPDGAGLTSPARPCECRSGERSDPASKPESSSSERRTDQARGDSIGLVFDHPRPAIALSRLIPPVGSLSKIPLYLRTARLLI